MYGMTDVDFPKWLLDQRNAQGWTQSELARAAGVSRQVISDYEGYKRKYFDEDILKGIARALKMPAEVVFRAAGLLDAKPESDEWIEEMSHKISLLPPSSRGVISKLLDALLEESQPQTKPIKSKA